MYQIYPAQNSSCTVLKIYRLWLYQKVKNILININIPILITFDTSFYYGRMDKNELYRHTKGLMRGQFFDIFDISYFF